ncbi:hypothetical protein CKG00_10740 [Morganella morganii]|uniref:Uncharacterized protein n=1 Tax=Morganella morganii TaxID=582 RepID=A0A433ZXE3_MORMO|nr:hypothetical protein CKG00_10740 [Morganella morganii]
MKQTIILGKILIIKAKSGNFFTSAPLTGYHHPSRCPMTEYMMKLTAFLLPVSLFCAVLPAAQAEYSAYAARYRDCFRKSKTGDELLRAQQYAKKILR